MRVLVVDDDALARTVTSAMVRTLGHQCVVASGGAEAWAHLEADDTIDVLVADRMMPDVDGLELCRRTRERRPGDEAYTYVLIASGAADDGSAREGMLAGADDYLAKPLRLPQLEMKLIAAARVRALHQRLAVLAADLRASARRDPLTGLANRLQLTEDLHGLSDQARRYGHRYSVAMLDVDHFKRFNDRYGHPAGDRALQAVAGVLSGQVRGGDTSYRYGGEEFLCIFAGQQGPQAVTATARMLSRVRGLRIPHEDAAGGILTMSAGVSELALAPGACGTESVLQRADNALYAAKLAGRDRTALG